MMAQQIDIHQHDNGASTRSFADRQVLTIPEILWNPYSPDVDAYDTVAVTAASLVAAVRMTALRRLMADGYRMRSEVLYTPKTGFSAGIRVGIFDSMGCVEERFYTREGRGDIRWAVRTLVNIDERAPALWATEVI